MSLCSDTALLTALRRPQGQSQPVHNEWTDGSTDSPRKLLMYPLSPSLPTCYRFFSCNAKSKHQNEATCFHTLMSPIFLSYPWTVPFANKKQRNKQNHCLYINCSHTVQEFWTTIKTLITKANTDTCGEHLVANSICNACIWKFTGLKSPEEDKPVPTPCILVFKAL